MDDEDAEGLKVNQTAQDAMMQIDERRYALPYVNDGREIIKIGANYSSTTNNIDSWAVSRGEG